MATPPQPEYDDDDEMELAIADAKKENFTVLARPSTLVAPSRKMMDTITTTVRGCGQLSFDGTLMMDTANVGAYLTRGGDAILLMPPGGMQSNLLRKLPGRRHLRFLVQVLAQKPAPGSKRTHWLTDWLSEQNQDQQVLPILMRTRVENQLFPSQRQLYKK